MAKLGAIISFVSFVVIGTLYLVGFSVPYWNTWDTGNSDTHFGLWTFCILSQCYQWDNLDVEAYFTASQAFACLGLIALVPALVGHIVRLASPLQWMQVAGAQTAAASSVFAGALGGIGVAVFGVEYTIESALPNGWGYWLMVSSCALLILLGSISACWLYGEHRPVTTSSSQPGIVLGTTTHYPVVTTQYPSSTIVQGSPGTAQCAYSNNAMTQYPTTGYVTQSGAQAQPQYPVQYMLPDTGQQHLIVKY